MQKSIWFLQHPFHLFHAPVKQNEPVSQIKILFVSANPKDTDKLRLDEEVREIKEAMRLARKRDRFEIISEFAVRVDDLRRLLLEHTPQIVHFSGHGVGSQGIALENDSGKMQLVSSAALARLFKFFQSHLDCVFLNACYSEVQAEAIRQHIPYVVGMNQAIGDRAAIEFAKGFYDALGAGRSIEDAFEYGCITIDLSSIPESSTPVLKCPQTQRRLESVGDEDIETLDAAEPEDQRSEPQAELVLKDDLALEDPEGLVLPESAFYIDRPPIEPDCYETLIRPGALIRVKAPRQMGKTSLLLRILQRAKQQGYHTAQLSFQLADAQHLQDLDLFLKWFCASISNELNLPNQLNDYWQDDFLGAKDKCTNYFQRYLLAEIKTPIALGLDEVDEVFKHPEVAVEIFGLLRAWHERAKSNPVWQKLRLIITHSKEVYIPLNINQSPFNVGFAVDLPVFKLAQVQELVQRHQIDWTKGELEQLMTLLGGHPYLVRVALYHIARHRITLERLKQVAATEEGFYSDHLRRHLLNLQDDPALLDVAKQVFAADCPVDVGTTAAFKLRSMGIVGLRGNAVVSLCDLYRQYFCDRLGVTR